MSTLGPPAGSPEGAPLDTYANNSSPPPLSEGYETGFRRRFALLRFLWESSSHQRVRKCRKVRFAYFVAGLGTRSGGDKASLGGLTSCGSIWSCPVCHAKIQARRTEELTQAMTSWEALANSHRVALLTLTLKHSRSDSLEMLWDALTKAWAKVQSGKQWKVWMDRLGSPGVVRAVEVTHGSNGWHVHLHVLVLTDHDGPDLDAFRKWVVAKWIRSVHSLGLDAPQSRGQDLRLLHSGEASTYITKTLGGLDDRRGLELTGAQGKRARSDLSTVTVWELLERASEGDRSALSLWHVYERVSKGRRSLTWSQGLRDALGLGEAQSDDEIAAELEGDELLFTVYGPVWDRFRRRFAEQIPDLLDSMREGQESACEFLAGHGVAFLDSLDLDDLIRLPDTDPFTWKDAPL